MADRELGLPYEKVRVLIDRYDAWSLSQSNFDHTAFSLDALAIGLRQILQSYDFDSQSFDILMAISCALEERHPKFKLVLVNAPKNGQFGIIRSREYWANAKAMADDVDIAIANGEKSEAAIAKAMEDYDLSRPETFRRLKMVRDGRAQIFRAHEQFRCHQQKCGVEVPPICGPTGYLITDEGKLAKLDD